MPLSAAAAWLLVEVFANRLLRDVDVALQEEVDTLATLIGRAGDDRDLADLLGRLVDEQDFGAGKQVMVLRGDRLVGEAPPGAHGRLTAPESHLRVARFHGGDPSSPLQIVVGVRAASALRARQRLTLLLGIGFPALLTLVMAGLWVVIGRTLRPLEVASRELGQITGENLAARVQVATTDDEIGRMVSVLNAMLARLEKSALELQRFTADAAHELRTPLTVLRTGLEVALGRERPAAEYRAALEEALAGTERLARLAEDLLTLARLDAGVKVRQPSALPLAEMLLELADAWTPVAQQRGVTVEVEAPPDLQVSGDEGDLYRLFSNLIANAVGHCSAGGHVSLGAQVDGASVCVTVADDGPGLAPGEAERIFDRFYRGNGARPGSGSGLGLSIARTIAEAHGGRLEMSNRPTGGCVASARLPLAA